MACFGHVAVTTARAVHLAKTRSVVRSNRGRIERVHASNPEPVPEPGCPESETGLCDRPNVEADGTRVEMMHGVAKILGENSVTYVFRPDGKTKSTKGASKHIPSPEDEKLGCIDNETGLCE